MFEFVFTSSLIQVTKVVSICNSCVCFEEVSPLSLSVVDWKTYEPNTKNWFVFLVGTKKMPVSTNKCLGAVYYSMDTMHESV